MSVHTSIPYLGELIADRYRLQSLLGQGGTGLVYAAHDEHEHRDVALKIAWSGAQAGSGGADDQALARFRREARVASALRHPGAVEVYEAGMHGGRLYLAMERLRGVTLAQRIRSSPAASLADIVRLGVRLAEVLEAAHAVPIVHRDLKPDNIFLDHSTAPERVVVLDFGLAFALDASDPTADRVTLLGITLGTPAYMSPEQIRNRGIGTWSDIYSLGCVLFELCTGQPPFPATSPAAVITDHILEPAPYLSDHRPDLPDDLGVLVASMLAKDPALRPRASALRDRLLALVSDGREGADRARTGHGDRFPLRDTWTAGDEAIA